MKKILLIIFIVYTGTTIRGAAQDPVFSLLYTQRVYYNPAFAGLDDGRAAVGFRDHYPGNEASFITAVASWDQKTDFLHGGYGVMIMHDRSAGGMLTTSGLSLTYSYHLQISRTLFLNSGFTTSLMQRYFDAGGIVLPDMISPTGGVVLPPGETITSESRFFPDFSVGFLMYTANWSAGVAAWHLMQPYTSEVKSDQTLLKRRYIFTFSYTIPTKNEFSFIPWGGGVIQGGSQIYLLGLQGSYKSVSIGGAWKKNFGNQYDMLICSMGIETGNVKFMYSYDVSVKTPPGCAGGGAHEAGIVVDLGKSRNRKTINIPRL